jgi:hypothetical protein
MNYLWIRLFGSFKVRLEFDLTVEGVVKWIWVIFMLIWAEARSSEKILLLIFGVLGFGVFRGLVVVRIFVL